MNARSAAHGALLIAFCAGWLLPWTAFLAGRPAHRVLLVLLLLVLPGWLAAGLLDRERGWRPLSRVPLGFALSVALVAGAGLVGRLLGLPLRFVSGSLFAAGLLAIAASWRRAPVRRAGAQEALLERAVSGAVLAGALLVAALLATSPPIGADSFTYGALIAAFEQRPLDFARIVFSGETTIAPRYWLAHWPLAEAVLARMADVDGLQLLGGLLAPLLAVLALLALRALGEALGLSPVGAVAAVLAQLGALLLLRDRLQPGRSFFWQLADDKFLAVYVFTPVALAAIARHLSSPSRRALLLVAATWTALVFAHPTSLGVALLVAAGFCVLHAASTRDLRGAVAVLCVVVPLTGTVAALRFVPHPQHEHVHFDVDAARDKGELSRGRAGRLSFTEDGRFFAASRSAAPAWLLVCGAVALGIAALRWRRDALARFVLAALAVVALAVIPYTAWALARLITPFHLWRVVSFTPFGLAFVLVVRACAEAARRRLPATVGRPLAVRWAGAAALLALAAAGALLLSRAEGRLARRLTLHRLLAGSESVLARCGRSQQRTRFTTAELRAAGAALAARGPGVVVLGDQCINDLVPSIAAGARLATFRVPIEMLNHGDFALEDARRAWRLQRRVVDGTASPDEAAAFLRAHGVEYVLQSGPGDWLERIPAALVGRRPVFERGRLRLYRVTP